MAESGWRNHINVLNVVLCCSALMQPGYVFTIILHLLIIRSYVHFRLFCLAIWLTIFSRPVLALWTHLKEYTRLSLFKSRQYFN